MDKFSIDHLKNDFAAIDVFMDTLAIQIELENIQDLKWALTSIDSDPFFTIYQSSDAIWLIKPNGLISGGLTSWFGKTVGHISQSGSKRQHTLISVRITVRKRGTEEANLSLQALSMNSILMKARMKLGEST